MPLPQPEALAELTRLRDVLEQLRAGPSQGVREAALAQATRALAQVESALHANQRMREALHKAVAHSLTDTPPREFLAELLTVLLELTDSQYGFIGEVMHEPDGTPYLKTHAITNIAWDETSRAFYDAGIAQGLEFRNLHTLFGSVLTTGRPVLINDPASDPRRGGLPPGHPPLQAFLGLPCHLGGELIGMVGIANRPGGYTVREAEFFQPVLDTCGMLISSFRQHQQRRQAEDTLRASEERYRALVENTFEAIVLLDAQGIILHSTPAYARVMGRTEEETIGRLGFEDVHPDDLEDAQAAFTGLLQTPGGKVTRCLRIQHRNGTWRWIEGIASNWLDNPAIRAIVVNFRDVTARQDAEERQRQLEGERAAALQQLRLILDHMPMACMQNDAHGNFTYWNPAAEKIFGYRCAEVQGKHPFGLITPPASQAAVADIFRRLAEGENLIEGEGENCTRDGRTLLCEWSNSPLRGPDGRFLGFVSMCRDITRQRQTEEARQRSEQLFRAVSEQMPDGLLLMDPDDPEKPVRIVEANEAACRMHQAARDQMVGSSIADWVDPTTAAQIPERLQRLCNGETLCFDAVHRHADHSLFPVEVVARMMSCGGRRLVLALDRDISERRKAEELRRKLETQLQHAQKMESLGVLAGGVAHDFNNLLTSILGNVSLALMDLPPGSPAAYSLQQIETAACRAAELTKQMLAYSGKGRFLIQPLNLSHVVEEMANLLQTVISKKAVLRFDFSPNLPAIRADATQVRQVVMNLITNASDAMGDKNGVITLRTGVLLANREYLATTYAQDELPEGYYVCVDVTDTGCGMDAPTLAKIFNPFFTTKHTGRGLGLAAVLGIMRGHRGAVKVQSELGRGSSFRLLFPCEEQAVQDGPTETQPQPLHRGSGHILVADDEETVRALAARLLEKAGFKVLLAADGREAVDLYRRHAAHVRLVLLDWTMPHMGGEEAFHELRLHHPDVRVMFMSGYQQQDAVAQVAHKGLAGFLQKPFRASDFLTQVQQALEAESTARK